MTYDRNPSGKFIGRSEVLSAWLPTMLGWVHYGNGLVSMLEIACRYCVEQAAAEYEHQAKYLREYTEEREMWLAPTRRAELMRQRREVLFEAIEKLKAIT